VSYGNMQCCETKSVFAAAKNGSSCIGSITLLRRAAILNRVRIAIEIVRFGMSLPEMSPAHGSRNYKVIDLGHVGRSWNTHIVS